MFIPVQELGYTLSGNFVYSSALQFRTNHFTIIQIIFSALLLVRFGE